MPFATLAASPIAAWAKKDRDKKDRKDRKKKNPLVNVPVEGSGPDGETFVRQIDIKKFDAKAGEIVALAQLTGVYSVPGEDDQDIDERVEFEVETLKAKGNGRGGGGRTASAEAVCRILDLDLGPLDLNLLGLRIQLNLVRLDVTAIPGGGLLGDLLCAVANLLNGGGALARIARILSRILRELASA